MDAPGPLGEILALLLARHRAVLTPAPHALIRADQVMLHGTRKIPASLTRWVGRAVPVTPDLYRLPLLGGSGATVLSVLGDAGDAAVAPVHLMQAAPRFRGGPATDPVALSDPPPAPPAPRPSARPVTVAILDTGIAQHPWFDDRPWFTELTKDRFEVLDADRDDRLDVLAGHGTFVAGILAQQAPDARLEIVRLLGSDGVCDEIDLVAALGRLPPVDVVNLSLGCHTWDDKASVALADAVDGLGADTVVVAAAGNEAMTRPFWPAALPSVVGVGALNAAGTAAAEFSNRGEWVDACAVGEDVCGAFVDLDTDAATAIFARWSGTSFAAPAVASAIARSMAEQGSSVRAAAETVLRGSGARRVPGLGMAVH